MGGELADNKFHIVETSVVFNFLDVQFEMDSPPARARRATPEDDADDAGEFNVADDMPQLVDPEAQADADASETLGEAVINKQAFQTFANNDSHNLHKFYSPLEVVPQNADAVVSRALFFKQCEVIGMRICR